MEKTEALQGGKDSNLLFGVLAVQMNFISPQQLAAAAGLWSVEQSSELGEILVDSGYLSIDDKSSIDSLLEYRLNANNGDVKATLASFQDDVKSTVQTFNPDVKASLVAVAKSKVQPRAQWLTVQRGPQKDFTGPAAFSARKRHNGCRPERNRKRDYCR